GIARLWLKDEGGRFGLGSFKALGGAYAVFRYLATEVGRRTGGRVTSADLLSGGHRAITQRITIATQTDGNHGRSVAWGCQMFGCRAVIYTGAGVSENRRAAIASHGAEVIRVAGTYDEAARQMAAAAAAHGWHLISDTTSDPSDTRTPRQVMQGYLVMAQEIAEQLGGEPPSYVFLQAGCGGLAAAVCAHFWQSWGARRPRVVIVEPERADCVFLSMSRGRPTAVAGDLETVMGGLSCGEVSLAAWPILSRGADDFLAIDDAPVAGCMRALAEGIAGDPAVVVGEAGVGGLAGLMVADAALRRALGLGADARVLAIASEGATDPAIYRDLVGHAPAAVTAA
ncbi:MAG: diaminopropionate ammonia-lyase, partial [Alphaproteobacteria bacterium]|nr:diaminopropionate ammonia-lyase [Alphaproteobacteria bacterium]